MKRSLAGICALALWGGVAAAEVTVARATIPAAPPGVRAHAAYLDLTNHGPAPRALIGVSAPGYGAAHLHQSADHDGVATMTMIQQLEIAPGQTVSLRPGGLHIMLMMPAAPQRPGDSVPLVLRFANGDEVTARAVVSARDAGS